MLRDKHTEAKRRAIIAAAKRLIKNTGYDAFNVSAVAREAGISKATFYAYFDSKEALRQTLRADGIEGLDTRDKRAVIIEAALRTFAERGFHATSLEDIAEAAGITKGTIYWYFKQKDEILKAIPERVSPLISHLHDLWGLMDRPPEEVLLMFARNYLATFTNPHAARLFRTVLTEAPHYPEIATSFTEIISGVLEFIVAYLQHQTALGRLRPGDINSSARAFMGMLLIYIMGREIFPLMGAGFPEPDLYAKQLVNIFLEGLKPYASATSIPASPDACFKEEI
ncbi:MAG: TetR/AcrR family transcriptional regulator [Chloroflexota bacterium]